jgi:hypothetical protein
VKEYNIMLFYALNGLETSQPATAAPAVPPNNHKSSNWVINLGWGVRGRGMEGGEASQKYFLIAFAPDFSCPVFIKSSCYVFNSL